MFRTLLAIITAVVCTFAFASNAAAQPKKEGEIRMVLLNVPGGGTDKVADKLLEIEGVQLRDQKWFVREIKKRGMTPKRIMSRPKDLVWIMQGGAVDFILYFEKDAGDLSGTVVGSEGKPVGEFGIELSGKRVSDAGLAAIKSEMEALLGVASEAEEAETGSEESEEGTQVRTLDSEEAEEGEGPEEAEEPEEVDDSEPWLHARLNGQLFKRDLVYAGATGAVLTYKSSFYPGFSVGLDAFLGPNFAVLLDYAMGFDSLTFEARDAEGNPESVTESIGHMEIEGGALYRVGATSSKGTQVDVKFSARHERYTLGDERALPSLTRTSVVLGGSVARSFLVPQFLLRGHMEVSPAGLNHAGADLFGESSGLTYGFSAGVGGQFDLSDSLGASFGYRFRFTRASFSGEGTLDFTDTTGFELVQGLHLGILYRY